MFELPKSCKVNKFIPKKSFYEKIKLSSRIKNSFISEVEKITWLYKLAPETIGINKSDLIEEIQIFELVIKTSTVPLKVIDVISSAVKYPILFVVKYEEKYCFAMRHDKIYFSKWNDQIIFNFFAINLQFLYESMIKSIINENIKIDNFDVLISNVNKKENLVSRISVLDNKIKNEKQFNKKAELNIERNRLKKEMENI